MARYILSDEFTATAETEGTLVNISNVPAEVSESTTHGSGIILFPRQHFGFNKKIYAARAPGGLGTAVVAAIATNAGGGVVTISGGETTIEPFTPSDVDDVFTNSDFTATGMFTQDDIDDVFR